MKIYPCPCLARAANLRLADDGTVYRDATGDDCDDDEPLGSIEHFPNWGVLTATEMRAWIALELEWAATAWDVQAEDRYSYFYGIGAMR